MKKILFIEDESALQNAATKVFKEEGYDVLSALDGETGLAAAKREKPDLVLLDLILPRMDGFAVLEALKKDEATSDIPVIVLSNLEGGADIERALGLGATTYLVKANYRLEEVVEKVRKVLGNESR